MNLTKTQPVQSENDENRSSDRVATKVDSAANLTGKRVTLDAKVNNRIAAPRITFDERLKGVNLFHDVFGSQSADKWLKTLIDSIDNRVINGVEFPTFPPAELQNLIHGHSGPHSLEEAATFYKMALKHGLIPPYESNGYLLDFGSGWGRILRLFMRDFPLANIIGFEPNHLFCTVARANNPYVSFLSGEFVPTNILPAGKFNLAVGWSIYSHLSRASAIMWLAETARVLAPGGAAMYTTWGPRFLQRLKREAEAMKQGKSIHWYSQVCIASAKDLDARLADYARGEFVWFCGDPGASYGEAFISKTALERLLRENAIPLTVEVFDQTSLAQDMFILRRG